MKKTIRDYELKDKKVIIRCDLNVPLKDKEILDDNRIKESLKTIKYAIDKGAKIIILSHLGRINSMEDKEKYSLEKVAKRLSLLLKKDVKFIDQTQGSVVKNAVDNMKAKEIILLQNVRFLDYPDKKESGNDDKLGRFLASLGDIFINDAFGVSHRSPASLVGISKYIPSGIGFLVEKEIKMLKDLSNPKRPYVVIMGGAKISDKIKLIDKLVLKADYILLAGGIANTFLKAKGFDVKKSIYDKDSLNYCKDLLNTYKDKLILPVDGYGSFSYDDASSIKYEMLNDIKENIMMLDIGPKTISLFKSYINKAKTIFWNGPVGVFEFSNFQYGTKSLCEALSKTSADVIAGGGDCASCVIKFGYKDKFKHVSTGGGAALEFIEKGKLPGIDCINDK